MNQTQNQLISDTQMKTALTLQSHDIFWRIQLIFLNKLETPCK